MSEELTRQCVNCGARIPIIFGFRTWCDQCNWNLEDTSYQHPRGIFERTWAWIAARQRRSANGLTRFQQFFATVLVFLLASLVHLFTLFLFYIAFQLLLMPLFFRQFLIISIGQWIAAGLILLVAAKIFPRIPHMPKDVIRRERAPTLFRLADRVAGALNVPPVQAIALTADFSTCYEETGLRGERVLYLSLPAMMALQPQEWLSLVAHALSHYRTGDPRRHWLVMSGMESLVAWHKLFRLDRLHTAPLPGLAGLVNLAMQAVAWTLSSLAWITAAIMAVLLYPVLRHGEMQADEWSARVTGRQAVAEFLRKSHLRGSYNNILVKAAHTPGIKVLREIRQRLSHVPEREMMRIQRIIDQGEARLGITHPTTHERLERLSSSPEQPGEIQINANEYARIQVEIAPFEVSVEQQILQNLPSDRKVGAV